MENKSSVDILYGSLVSDYRTEGVAKEEHQITKVDVGAKDMQSFEQDLTDIEGNEDKKAGASFDSIYTPYSTYFQPGSGETHPVFSPGVFGSGGLPHFERPIGAFGSPANSLTLNPFNPNNSLTLSYSPTGSLLYRATITGTVPQPDELIFSQADTITEIGKERGDFRKGKPNSWLESGHNISMAVNGTGNRYNTDFDYQFTEHTGWNVEVTNIRGVGLRAPLVLTGWGFDTNAAPVPADTGNARIFASGAFKDPSLWKSGPVDLRWDNDRKVWTGAGTTEIMRFTVTQPHTSLYNAATACDHVLATVNDVGCTTQSVVIGQTGVLVFDDDACFFNLPVSVLIGMKGTAEKFVNPFASLDPEDDDQDCSGLGRNQGACRWVVTGLCCNEEIIVPVPVP